MNFRAITFVCFESYLNMPAEKEEFYHFRERNIQIFLRLNACE